MYLPVEFDLHDFQLGLSMKAAANFHKRMKELGFDVTQQGDTMIWGRGKSRITAFLNKDMSLNFLPDFFDDTPGGTVYAIFEKLCMNFGGTMVGQYKVPTTGQAWDIRISGGMNLSGRPDVGQREHVMDNPNATPSSSGSVPTANQQTAQASPQAGTGQSTSRGQVSAGQQGQPSARDKLYKVLVEEQYANHVKQHGEDPNVLIGLIKQFKKDYPEQTEEEKKQEAVLNAACQFINTSLNNLSKALGSLDDDERDSVIVNISDVTNYDYDEVEDILYQYHRSQSTQSAVTQATQQFVGQPNNAATQAQMAQAVAQTMTPATAVPAGWQFNVADAQELVRLDSMQIYYASLLPTLIDEEDVAIAADANSVLYALKIHSEGEDIEDVYEALNSRGLTDIAGILPAMKLRVENSKKAVGK